MFSSVIVPGLELKLCKDKVKTVNDSDCDLKIAGNQALMIGKRTGKTKGWAKAFASIDFGALG